MPRFICEAHKFILNTGAIPRADAFDFAAIHGRFTEITAHDIGRFRRRVSHPTRDLFTTGLPTQAAFTRLFHVEQILRIARIMKGKESGALIAFLLLHPGKIQAAAQ